MTASPDCARCGDGPLAHWWTVAGEDLCAPCMGQPTPVDASVRRPPTTRDTRLLIVAARHEPAAEQGQRNPPEPLDGRDFAGAVFERDGDAWRCARAVPVLDWMVGLAGAEVKRKLELPKNAWRWRYRWASRFEVTA